MGTFNADKLKVGGSVYLSGGSEFNGVDLIDASIEGGLAVKGSCFSGKFNASELNLGGNLLIRGSAECPEGPADFNGVYLWGAEIGNSLDLSDVLFSGSVDCRARPSLAIFYSATPKARHTGLTMRHWCFATCPPVPSRIAKTPGAIWTAASTWWDFDTNG